MPSSAVNLVPGVNSVKTPSKNEAGISASQFIRFKEGLVEKLGGWAKYYASTLLGVPRTIWPWRDFENTTWVAVGTTTNVYAITGGTGTDITPRIVTSTLTTPFSTQSGNPLTIYITDPSFSSASLINPITVNIEDIVSVQGVALSGFYEGVAGPVVSPFSVGLTTSAWTGVASNVCNYPTYNTTSGSQVVTITLTSHGLVVGSRFAITNPVSVGGLTISGPITVDTVPTANTFTFLWNHAATSTATNAVPHVVTIQYFYSPKYGNPTLGTAITTRDWSLGNYGQLLIACPYQGTIYQWQTNGPYVGLNPILNAPQATGIVISDASQQIIAYGGNPLSLFDPNFVAWSDTANITNWTAAVGNQAGSYRIPTGSGIMGAATVASNVILLWTDVDVWLMQYVGYPLVYGFTKIAVGCGLIGQFAWAKFGTYTVWMSQERFWFYDGNSVQPLDCPVYDSIFPILSAANVWKIRGATNSQFNEVQFFFPSTSGSGENDMYVKFNPIEGAWDYGALDRSAWADQSVAGPPLGASQSGILYQHEVSPNADGSPLLSSFVTGLSQMDEGEQILYVDRIRPDFKFPLGTGTVQVTVYAYKYPGDTPVVKGSFSFTQATEYISLRCRGRYLALKFASTDLNSFWRIGRTQVRFGPGGRR